MPFMSSPFERLALELKDSILAQLSLPDLLALATTSRILSVAAKPYLYKTITIHWNKKRVNPRPLISLLCALLQKPILATYVRDLSIITTSTEDAQIDARLPQQDIRKVPGFEDHEIEIIQTAINATKLNEKAKWSAAICQQKDMSAVAAFIVSKLIALKSLSVPADFMRQDVEDNWFMALFSDLNSAQQDLERDSFRNLQRLVLGKRLEHREIYPETSTMSAMIASQIQNISELEVWGSYQHNYFFEDIQKILPSAAGGLISLKLTETDVQIKSLERMLRNQSVLEHFVYDGYTPSSQSTIDLDDLKMSLEPARNSLTYLSIGFDMYADEALDVTSISVPILGRLGSFRNFTNLISLDISFPLLFGMVHPDEAPPLATCLPRSLKALTINGSLIDYNSFYEWQPDGFLATLHEFLSGSEADTSSWRSATPDLRDLIIDMRQGAINKFYTGEDGTSHEWIRLSDRCLNEGIRCRLINDDL